MLKAKDVPLYTIFGKFQYVGNLFVRNQVTFANFLCHCGKEFTCRFSELVNGRIKSCGCKSKCYGWKDRKKQHGDDYPYYIVHSRCHKTARAREIPFEITICDIKNVYQNQSGKCYYSGQSLALPNSFVEMGSSEIEISVDRIDSNVGYVCTNIVLTTGTINYMKVTLPQEKFINYCSLVAQNS